MSGVHGAVPPQAGVKIWLKNPTWFNQSMPFARRTREKVKIAGFVSNAFAPDRGASGKAP